MYYGAWQLVFVLGVLSTGTALYLAARNTPDDDAVVILAGIVGFVVWAVWSYGALHLETPVSNNNALKFVEPAVAGVGVLLAVVSIALAITGPFEIVSRWREGRPEDV